MTKATKVVTRRTNERGAASGRAYEHGNRADCERQSLALPTPDEAESRETDISFITRVWPMLRPHVREAIITLVDSALVTRLHIDGEW